MSSVTASLHQPRGGRRIHSGVTAITSRFTTTGTLTASSEIVVGHLPHGGKVLDFHLYADDAAANQAWRLGIRKPEGSTSGSTTISASELMGQTSVSSLSTVMRYGDLDAAGAGKLPFRLSLSDEAIPRYALIVAINTIAISASLSLAFMALVQFDDEV